MNQQGGGLVFGSVLSRPRNENVYQTVPNAKGKGKKSQAETTWDTERKAYMENHKKQLQEMQKELNKIDKRIAKTKGVNKQPHLAWQTDSFHFDSGMFQSHDDNDDKLHNGSGKFARSVGAVSGGDIVNGGGGGGLSKTLPNISRNKQHSFSDDLVHNNQSNSNSRTEKRALFNTTTLFGETNVFHGSSEGNLVDSASNLKQQPTVVENNRGGDLLLDMQYVSPSILLQHPSHNKPFELPIFSLPPVRIKTPPKKEDLSKLTPMELKRRAAKIAIQNNLKHPSDFDDDEDDEDNHRSAKTNGNHHHHHHHHHHQQQQQQQQQQLNRKRIHHGSREGKRRVDRPKQQQTHHEEDGMNSDLLTLASQANIDSSATHHKRQLGETNHVEENANALVWLHGALHTSELAKEAIVEATRISLESLRHVKGLPPPTTLRAQVFLQSRGFGKMKSLVANILLVKQIDALSRWKDFLLFCRQQDELKHMVKRGKNKKVIHLMKSFFLRFKLEAWLKWLSFIEYEIRQERFADEDAAARLLQNIWRGKVLCNMCNI
jgi:hypothetical protein